MIPKTLHLIWLGSPLPGSAEHYLQGFKTMNPNWHTIIWDEETLAGLDMINREEYERKNMPTAFRADVARLEILRVYGGLYADCDVEWKRPLDDGFIPNESLAWFCREDDWTVNNGVIACSKGHPAIMHLIERLPERVARLWKPTAFLPAVTGPGLMQHLAELPDGVASVWPLSVVGRKGRIARDPYCIHHYAGSWGWGQGT